MLRSVLGFLATLAVIAALVVLAVYTTFRARSVVPFPFNALLGAAVFGLSLLAVVKAATKKFGA